MTAAGAFIVLMLIFTKWGQMLLLTGLALLILRPLLSRGRKMHHDDPRIDDALDIAARDARAMRFDGVTKARPWNSFVERHTRRLTKLGLDRHEAIAVLKETCQHIVPSPFGGSPPAPPPKA